MSQPISLFYILSGMKLLTKPGIKRFVIIPLLLNMMLFGSLFVLANHYYHLLSAWLNHQLPHWLAWLVWVVWLLFLAGFLLIFIYAFTTLSNLISAPFNSLLSEKVEFYLTGQNLEKRTFSQNMTDIPRIVGRQLAIIGYYLPRALLILALFLIPIVQIFAAILWFAFNAWFMSLQYIDYPADNNRVSLKAMRLKMNGKKADCLQFGVGVLILSMIPLVNFIVMPSAIAGATQLWLNKLTND